MILYILLIKLNLINMNLLYKIFWILYNLMSLIRIILFLLVVISASALPPYECSCFETRGIEWGSECEKIPEEDRVCVQKTLFYEVFGNCVHRSYITWQKTCKIVKGYGSSDLHWEFKN